MKISDIKPQVKNPDRSSIYLDGKYSFSLNNEQLAKAKLEIGDEISPEELKSWQAESELGKIEAKVLNYLSYRPRSIWEIEEYFKREKISKGMGERLLERLKGWGYVDDRKFAESWVQNRRAMKSVSRRRLQQELRAKHIDSEIIEEVLAEDETSDTEALVQLIENKRRQSRYADDQKLMAYLARQGFGYGDIKAAMSETENQD